MRRYLLFALSCLVLSGFGCNNQNRSALQGSAGSNSCQPAILYQCGTCDDGQEAWKQCKDDGKSFGECLCPTPASKADGGTQPPSNNPPTPANPDSGIAANGCPHMQGMLPNGSNRQCGYNLGDCHAGTQTCVNNVWTECSGGTLPTAETCDGRDNNCNGKFDDGIVCECDPNAPPRDCGPSEGMCRSGKQYCVKSGDGYRWSGDCVNGTGPRQERCDNLDWDCDGVAHNGFDLANDPLNCGACGNSCQRANAFGSCVVGACRFSCQVGFYDLNGKNEDGCEYMCPYTKPLVSEIPNGLDDNCNGLADEGFSFDTDSTNCGKPGRKCQFTNANASCVDGDCRLGACASGFVDKDKDPWNGCEYQCAKTSATEACGNKLDDDCDGEVDEDCDCDPADTAPVLCGLNTGTCKSQKTCQAGGKYGPCIIAVGPKAKQCDGANHMDFDCNGIADESEFDRTKDVKNCGACGNACSFPNAAALCVNGACQMGTCSLAYHDLDKDPKNGCEYGPILPTSGGIEQCDGIDNDVNGKIDDGTAVCACTLVNSERECGPPAVGECRPGKQTCSAPGQWSVCDMAKAVLPAKEICNGKDDDCDNVADNGFDLQTDPSNCGACNVRCSVVNGTASCVAGKCAIAKCDPYFKDMNGKVEDGCESGPCISEGTEVCDGRDNDCNGKIDDVAGVTCGCVVGSTQTCGKNVGECHAGNQACLGPAPGHWGPCQNEQFGVPETCDNRDNDCDGKVDNNFSFATDVKNCGACGNVCKFANAAAMCVDGGCQMGACDANWFDFNKNAADGCEKPCVLTNGGVEQCDMIDNDCDGVADEGFNAQIDLLNCGACGHACIIPNAVPVCTNGSCQVSSCNPGSWDLNKNPLDGCEYACTPSNGGQEVCDGKDNDCDGTPDDGIDCACENGKTRECGTDVGMCEFGTQTCVSGVWQTCTDMVNPRPIVCDAFTDLNCNGITDAQEWDVRNDVANCGSCGNVCGFANASVSCAVGICAMGSCASGYFNLDGSAANGCEYGTCYKTRGGVEYCDAIDNDCDGAVDNATVTVQSDPANCGACGKVCALPNTAVNGCSGGACTIVHCLPGWNDANGVVSDGCEQAMVPPDAGTGGSGGAGDAGSTGGSGGSGGAGSDAGTVIPNSIGTITCTQTGQTMTVSVVGLVSLGLDTVLPAGSISSLALGMDANSCWPANGATAGCLAQSVEPSTVDTVVHNWVGVPLTRFTPRVTSSAWFDLRAWTILGDCYREGCGFCRTAQGESCVPTLEPPNGCIVRAKSLSQ